MNTNVIFRAGAVCAAVLLTLAVIACPSSSGGSGDSQTVNVTGVSIAADGAAVANNAEIVLAHPDDTASSPPKSVQLSAVVAPANASNKNLVWDSSDQSNAIIVLDKSSTVTAKGEGQATVTVTTADGNFSAAVKIKVLAKGEKIVPVQSVSITINGDNPTSGKYTIYTGENAAAHAVISPANATSKGVTWTSSSTAVATINENGSITPLTTGKTTITATSTGTKADGNPATASVEITVEKGEDHAPVESLTLDLTSAGEKVYTLSLDTDTDKTVTATVLPAGAVQTVAWVSGDETIVTVAGGKITAVGKGSTTITVSTNGYNADNKPVSVTINVTVTEAGTGTDDPAAVIVTFAGSQVGDTLALTVNEEKALTVAITPASASQGATVTSGTPAVVSVEPDGNNWNLTALSAGQSIITAVSTAKDTVKKEFTVTVTAGGDGSVTKVELDTSALSFFVGENGWTSPASTKLTATTEPVGKAVKWESGDDATAAVGLDGTVTPKKAGTVTITAKAEENESISASATVTITPLELKVYNQKAAGTLDSTTTTVFPAANSDGRFVIVNKEDGAKFSGGTSTSPYPADSVENSTVVYLNAPLTTLFTIKARVRNAEIYGTASTTTGVLIGGLSPAPEADKTKTATDFNESGMGVRFVAMRVVIDGSRQMYMSRNNANNTSTASSGSTAIAASSDNVYREYIFEVGRSTNTGNSKYIAKAYDKDDKTTVKADLNYDNNSLHNDFRGTSPVYPGFVIAGVQTEIAEIEIKSGDTVIYKTPAVSAAPVPVSGITISMKDSSGTSDITAVPATDYDHYDNVTNLTGGVKFVAVPTPSDAAGTLVWTIENQSGAVTWDSTTQVVSFSAEGSLTVKAATQTIPLVEKTFTIGAYTGATPATGVDISTTNPANQHQVKKGNTLQLNAQVKPVNADQTVAWKLSTSNTDPDMGGDTGIATIGAAGLVTTSGYGTIYAYAVTTVAKDITGTDFVTSSPWEITVPYVSGVTLASSPSSGKVKDNATDTVTITATVTPANFVSPDVTWKLSTASTWDNGATETAATAIVTIDSSTSSTITLKGISGVASSNDQTVYVYAITADAASDGTNKVSGGQVITVVSSSSGPGYVLARQLVTYTGATVPTTGSTSYDSSTQELTIKGAGVFNNTTADTAMHLVYLKVPVKGANLEAQVDVMMKKTSMGTSGNNTKIGMAFFTNNPEQSSAGKSKYGAVGFRASVPSSPYRWYKGSDKGSSNGGGTVASTMTAPTSDTTVITLKLKRNGTNTDVTAIYDGNTYTGNLTNSNLSYSDTDDLYIGLFASSNNATESVLVIKNFKVKIDGTLEDIDLSQSIDLESNP